MKQPAKSKGQRAKGRPVDPERRACVAGEIVAAIDAMISHLFQLEVAAAECRLHKAGIRLGLARQQLGAARPGLRRAARRAQS